MKYINRCDGSIEESHGIFLFVQNLKGYNLLFLQTGDPGRELISDPVFQRSIL